MNRHAYFNDAADTWDQVYGTPELLRFLEHFVPTFGLQPGQRVLDVGTGTGILIPFLRSAVGESGSITAIDYAANMVQICRSKYGQLPNVTIQLQDVEALTLPPASFDAVTGFGIFPHIDNKVTALANLYQVLKPRGRLIIAHALSSAEIHNHHHHVASAVALDELPTEPVMRRLLHHAGFTAIAIQDEPGYYLCVSSKPGQEAPEVRTLSREKTHAQTQCCGPMMASGNRCR